MIIPTPQVKFIASLSNGETVVEGKADFKYIDGNHTPWIRLVRYATENKLDITSLSLFTPDGRTFTLPSRGKNPKFKAFDDADKPLDYQIDRKLGREQKGVRMPNGGVELGKVEIKGHFTVGVAYFADHKVEVWVDEEDTRNSWYLTSKLK